MSRTGILIVNTALFVLCCFLAATLLNEALAEIAAPSMAPNVAGAAEPLASAKSWEGRQVILDRNLFNVSTLAPAPLQNVPLEATKLPLKLLGTAAARDPKHSWAAVQDLDDNAHLVVRVDDILKDTAQVTGIERRRIVLDNNGKPEELALEEESAPKRVAKRSPRANQRRRGRSPRGKNPPAGRLERVAQERLAGNQAAQETATSLFSQARILPRYVEGAMVGVQVNAIKSGSMLQEIGLLNGDTITEVNGIRISSPEDSTSVLRELAQAEHFTLVVNGSDGLERTLTYEVSE